MPSRCYFIDALTNEEIPCEWNGWFPAGEDASAASPASGIQYTDTMWCITVKPAPYARGERKITAADFPGRLVVVKLWHSGVTRPGADYRMLVTREMGFALLSEVQGRGPARTADGVTWREHVRGEIRRDRRALEWIARRIAAKAAA